MSITVENSGSLTLDGTEQTLGAAFTAARFYGLNLYLNDIGKGDELAVRAYLKVRSASNERLCWKQTFRGRQGDDAATSAMGDIQHQLLVVPSPNSVRFTVTRVANGSGAFDTLPWAVVSLGTLTPEADGQVTGLGATESGVLGGTAFTGAKVYTVLLDLTDLVDDDALRLLLYTKERAAGAERLTDTYAWVDQQGDNAASAAEGEVVIYTAPVYSPSSFSPRLMAVAGTIDVHWQVVSTG